MSERRYNACNDTSIILYFYSMPYADVLLLVGRVLFGGFFVMNGLNHFMKIGMMKGYAQSKKVPMPGAAVAVSGLLLLIGGIGMLFGVWVPWAVLAIVLFFVPVSFMMHNFWAIPDPQQKMMEQVNFMKNMALFGAALMMLAIGEPWPYSL